MPNDPLTGATPLEFIPVAGTDTVLAARQGPLARIRLNRPQAINALTLTMVGALQDQLDRWRDDPGVGAVLLDGAGERGFCAGGDVRGIREQARAGPAAPMAFWAAEYALDATIAAYPKPVVAWMHGVTMGGGLGLAGHAAVRLVDARARVAMPETAIGYFPDVGARFLLTRAPGELGTHVALTGVPVGGADAVHLGLADAVAQAGEAEEVAFGLAGGAAYQPPVPPRAGVEVHREWVDACYAGGDAAAIPARLLSRPEPAAHEAARVIQSRSPFSVAVTLAALRWAEGRPLGEVLAGDLLLDRWFAGEPDFAEGVRSVLVDKDHAPRWRHSSVADVDPAEVAAALAGDTPTMVSST